MKLFVSYRRNDTQDLAGRIADRLNAADGIDHVFIDVDGIEPGADFKQKIQSALAESDACLILIGDAWRGTRAEGRPRIFEDNDFVRLEAATALAGERRVIPLLANGARMPEERDLPSDLQRLPMLSALWVRHESFQHDMDYLTATLLGRDPRPSGAFARKHPALAGLLRACAGAAVALVLLVLGAAVHGHLLNRSLDATLGGQGEVWLLIGATLACGAGIGFFARRGRKPLASR